MGREGDRADVADQARWPIPSGVLNPDVVLQRDPGIHLRNLKSTPAIEDGGQRERVHRVRVLRAGLPEPRPHDHAAPADRAAPRDGAPARGLAGAPGAGRGVRLRRRWTPARPTARASSSARWGSTPASWSRTCAPARTPRARSARRCAPPGTTPRPSARRGRGCARAGSPPGCSATAPCAAVTGGLRRIGSEELVPALVARRAARRPGAPAATPSARAPPRCTCRRASIGSSACPAAPRTGGSRCPRRWSRSRRAPGCRCGSRPTWPATAARCRGARRAIARATPRWRPAPRPPCSAGPRAASCRW